MEGKLDLYILHKNPLRFEIVENVNLTEDAHEHNGTPYKIREDKIDFENKKDLRLYYRSGNGEPLNWERYDGKFSNKAMFMMEHDKSAIEGVLNMLGIGGAGNLKKSQWAIIIGVAAFAALAFFLLRPKIMAIMGM